MTSNEPDVSVNILLRNAPDDFWSKNWPSKLYYLPRIGEKIVIRDSESELMYWAIEVKDIIHDSKWKTVTLVCWPVAFQKVSFESFKG